jgi:hypothetical protein
MILESIYSFARNQEETINKLLRLDGRLDQTNKSNYKNVYPMLYKLQAR